MKYLKYITAYSVPLSVLISIYLGGWWSFASLIYLFGLIPILDHFSKSDTSNMNAVEEENAKHDRVYDYILYGLVPVQFIVIGYFCLRVPDPNLLGYEITGMIIACGLSCGLSINNAHELGHRNKKYEQFMSKLLLMSSLYMHFFIEHNRGHHKNVATENDPASSRYGENIYSFFIRTITGSWKSAWSLEVERLAKKGLKVWSWQNEMIRFQVIQLSFLLIIGLVFSWVVLGYFFVSAVIGFMLLETVNYIEHYGLQRRKNGDHYERTLPIHSWNSDHPLGRLILLELSRHSDHHYMASRKYQILRHFDESPQMPTGYPGTMLMALIPPLWFSVMHRRIDNYKLKIKEDLYG